MLDLERLQRIELSAEPLGQKLMGALVLGPNYELPPRVRIDVERYHKMPDQPVILAMNHTDRYNYWPFQYRLWRDFQRYTSTWVKGKYYENEWVGKFMELTNNIPTVSRGYLIARDFKAVSGRSPSDAEYRALRNAVDVDAGLEASNAGAGEPAQVVPSAVLEQPRDVLGRRFAPGRESHAHYINALFGMMMRRFVDLNEEAMDKGLDLLIFPQGTRSIRLSEGRIGLAQMALYLKKTIVPIGCNGSDKVYPGNSPIARPGHIVYRVGQPITYQEMAPLHIDEPFHPFTPEAEAKYHHAFRGLVDLVMERINELLDPPYQFAPDLSSDGVAGSRRFL